MSILCPPRRREWLPCRLRHSNAIHCRRGSVNRRFWLEAATNKCKRYSCKGSLLIAKKLACLLGLLVSYRPLALDQRSGPTTRRRGPRPFVLCLERNASSRLWRSLPFCSSLALAAKSGSVSSYRNRQHTEYHFYINGGCILQKNSATYRAGEQKAADVRVQTLTLPQRWPEHWCYCQHSLGTQQRWPEHWCS